MPVRSENEVTVCIPTLNEEESIGGVVEDVILEGYDPVVIDGGSTDQTVNIAEELGARVIEQTYEGGKGAAVVQAIDYLDSSVMVLIDGDGTYDVSDVPDLVDPIINRGVDQVIGNRFYDMKKDSMSLSHQFGNRGINLIFRVLYGENLVDILSGFRAINLASFDSGDISSREFDIETELCAYSVKNNHKVEVVGTSYYERKGSSKLSGLSDGFKILRRMMSEL